MARHKQQGERPTLAKACEFCRTRKIRCDSKKPQCGTCVDGNRECVFKTRPAKPRPTLAALSSLRADNEKLHNIIESLQSSHTVAALAQSQSPLLRTSATAPGISSRTESTFQQQIYQQTSPQSQGLDQRLSPPASLLPPNIQAEEEQGHHYPRSQQSEICDTGDGDGEGNDSDSGPDVSPFITIDDHGNLASYGPTSALRSSTPRPQPGLTSSDRENQRNGLIAKAAIARQKEHVLYRKSDIEGVPIELAMHLLELHWNRQHHTFLLTYRPAIMRDLITGGPYSSPFLLNAIFAVSAKYSRRPEVQEVLGDNSTSGARWFRRCDKILTQDGLLLQPSIPTVIGLALLGSTYNSRGDISKGWLLMGYAFRMAYDLGLHIDRIGTCENTETVEIRRRVFWGIFICDKLQSLYLGRPIAMHLADAHVSQDFLDTLEEEELWTPYADPTRPSAEHNLSLAATPVYSVSCFQRLCALSKIMEMIINNNYVIGATSVQARKGLHRIEAALEQWINSIPAELSIPSVEQASPLLVPAPNIFTIHIIYHTMVVLLHRPIIADGHLYAATASQLSLKRCTIAARAITFVVRRFYSSYGLRGAPYLMAYALYVACTIHVRNAAMFEASNGKGEHCTLLKLSLSMLEQLSVPNTGVLRPITIIRKLMVAKGVRPVGEPNTPPNEAETYPECLDPPLPGLAASFPSMNIDYLPDFNSVGPEAIANWLGDSDDPFRDDQLYGFMDATYLF